MYNFTEFLKDLSHSSNIQFNVVTEEGVTLYSSDLDIENSNIANFTIMLGHTKVIISLEKQYENCTSLLKYAMESKYKQHFLTKEQAVIDILENREISSDNINLNLPFLKNGCYIILISVYGSKYESLNIIKQIYNKEPVVSLIYNDGIIVIGAIIKGETEQYYILSQSVLPVILDLSVEFKIPITNGIVICENEQQALERSGGRVCNRGSEAAQALLNSLSVISQIKPL